MRMQFSAYALLGQGPSSAEVMSERKQGAEEATTHLDHRASASRTAYLYIVASTSLVLCGIETRAQPEKSARARVNFFHFLPGAALQGLGLHAAATSAYRTGAVPFSPCTQAYGLAI